MWRTDARGLLAFSAALALGGAIRADQTPAQQPTFRANVNVVQLDISVLDKDGRPVKGLAANDFTVLEDGKPQKVVAFGAVDVAEAVSSTMTRAAEWTRRVSPDVVTNQLDDRRLVMIVLDDATLIQPCDPPSNSLCPERPQRPAGAAVGGRRGGASGALAAVAPAPDAGALERAREAAHLVVDQLGPNDLASVTFTDLGTPPLDFTRDHVKLDDAIERFDTRFQPSCLTFHRALRTLKATADYMASVQNRRKTLIYIGGGIPVDFATKQMLAPVFDDESGSCGAMLIDTMKDVFISAQRSNVAMYTIDPFGLRSMALPGTGAWAEIDSQKILASNTGGRAIVDTNDFKPGVQQIFRENGSDYMVGYEPANTKEDGTIRRIDVKVDRPGVEVRTRRSYVAPDERKIAALAAAPSSPASVDALKNVLPKADLALVLGIAPFAAPAGKATVSVFLGINEPVQGAPRASQGDDVDVSVAALDPFGAVRGTARRTVHVESGGQTGDIARYEVETNLDVSPGSYEILVGASSKALGKDGSVYADLVVPNFAKDPLSMSGVVLSVGPIPTSRRSFGRTEHVTAYFEVYEGGQAALKPASVTTRIVDDGDHEAVRTAETITVGGFDVSKRAANHRFDIPLSTLKPGRYLLRVDATAGRTTAGRTLVFTVR